jgi:hypothetical protein
MPDFGGGWMTGAEVIGQASPLALGYMRKYPLMSETEVARVQASLAECARRSGYTLGTVHMEELHSDPKAFFEAVAAINLYDIAAVVVPTFAHLGNPRTPGSKRAHLDRETRARVLIADSSP